MNQKNFHNFLQLWKKNPTENRLKDKECKIATSAEIRGEKDIDPRGNLHNLAEKRKREKR